MILKVLKLIVTFSYPSLGPPVCLKLPQQSQSSVLTT